MAPAAAGQRDILGPHIDRLLSSREYPKTICPSEVPRALTAAELEAAGALEWRDLMPDTRQILWDMYMGGEVQVLQKGSLVPKHLKLDDVKGPIRARRVGGAQS